MAEADKSREEQQYEARRAEYLARNLYFAPGNKKGILAQLVSAFTGGDRASAVPSKPKKIDYFREDFCFIESRLYPGEQFPRTAFLLRANVAKSLEVYDRISAELIAGDLTNQSKNMVMEARSEFAASREFFDRLQKMTNEMNERKASRGGGGGGGGGAGGGDDGGSDTTAFMDQLKKALSNIVEGLADAAGELLKVCSHAALVAWREFWQGFGKEMVKWSVRTILVLLGIDPSVILA